MSKNKVKAEAAVKGLFKGGPDRTLLTEDFAMWAIGGAGEYGIEALTKLTEALQQLFEGPAIMDVIFSLEEEDRVALRARSEATFKDGGTYQNEYLYAIKFRDGLICEMQEFMNNAYVDEQIRPRIQQLMLMAAKNQV